MKSHAALAALAAQGALAALAVLSASATCLLLVACGDGASSSPSADSPDGSRQGADGAPGALDDAPAPPGDGGLDSTTVAGDASAGDAAGLAWQPLPPAPQTPELWYWHHSYLSPTSATEPAHSEGLIDQAAAAGYTGLAFWDSSLTFANRPNWDLSHLKTVVDYARSKKLKQRPRGRRGAYVVHSNGMPPGNDFRTSPRARPSWAVNSRSTREPPRSYRSTRFRP